MSLAELETDRVEQANEHEGTIVLGSGECLCCAETLLRAFFPISHRVKQVQKGQVTCLWSRSKLEAPEFESKESV